MAKLKMRDVIVVLPGITGSVLSQATGNGGRRDLWDVSGRALWSYLRSRGDSLQQLAVPQHDPRSDPPATDVAATGLVDGFHGVFGLAKIDGYKPIYDALKSRFDVTPGSWPDPRPANLLTFPYDWRLSNRAGAQAFEAGIRDKLAAWRDHSGEPEARLILVAHSMGGLVARYWLEVLEGWRETKALVTFGTPYRGSLDAVGYLANGYKRAFVDLTAVLLSCPSVYELLPIYRSVRQDGEWKRPSEVRLPLVDPGLGEMAARYVAAAAEFHDEIRSKVDEHANDPAYNKAYAVVPFVGVYQDTQQSALLQDNRLTVNNELPGWIEDDVSGGDGTVPRVSAIPIEMESAFGATFVGAKHSGLQNSASALDDLVERLRQSQSRHMRDIQGSYAPGITAVDLVVDDVFLPDEPVVLRARLVDRENHPVQSVLRVGVEPTGRASVTTEIVLPRTDDYAVAELGELAPGQYRVTVGVAGSQYQALPVTDVFEVAG